MLYGLADTQKTILDAIAIVHVWGYLVLLLHSSWQQLSLSHCFLASIVRLTVGWMLCRDNRAPAGGRGVVFVGGPGGGPNSAAYARPHYGARRNGGPPGPGTMQAQIHDNIARHAERAPEGPPQVNTPPAPAASMHSCSCLHPLLCLQGATSQGCTAESWTTERSNICC